MVDTQKQMTDDEFQLMCLENTYCRLSSNPGRFNLVPVQLIQPPGETPRFTCPGCMRTLEVSEASFILSCDVCEQPLLVAIESKDKRIKPGRRRRK